jgi:hypothetical protein
MGADGYCNFGRRPQDFAPSRRNALWRHTEDVRFPSLSPSLRRVAWPLWLYDEGERPEVGGLSSRRSRVRFSPGVFLVAHLGSVIGSGKAIVACRSRLPPRSARSRSFRSPSPSLGSGNSRGSSAVVSRAKNDLANEKANGNSTLPLRGQRGFAVAAIKSISGSRRGWLYDCGWARINDLSRA